MLGFYELETRFLFSLKEFENRCWGRHFFGCLQTSGLPWWLNVRNPPAKQGIWVLSLGQEDSLENAMALHSSILAWRFSWTEEPGGLWSMGLQGVGHDWAINTCTIHRLHSIVQLGFTILLNYFKIQCHKLSFLCSKTIHTVRVSWPMKGL